LALFELRNVQHNYTFQLLTASDGLGNVGRYGLNIGFNLLNKTVFNYFPFPWTVSAIHVLVGTLYCGVTYLLGFKEASFGRVRRRCLRAAFHRCFGNTYSSQGDSSWALREAAWVAQSCLSAPQPNC
jgi:hypothetical protein